VTKAPSPFAAISDLLLSIADGTSRDLSRGCFFVNATSELAPSDPEVGAIVRANDCRVVAAFENLRKEAKRRGEVEPALDERIAAKFLLTTIRGLRVSAKAGVAPEDLRGIATLALSSLKPRGAA
jgi:TetR/AcrR family transcriptional repressor of nem operon